jgi:hypothetical protein
MTQNVINMRTRRPRWHNTAHWQRLVSTFRETDGSRWRTAAATMLGCEQRDLRAIVDRPEMPPVEIKARDAMLIDHLHRYAVRLQARADEVYNVARSVMRATNEVSIHSEIEIPIQIEIDGDAPEFDVETATPVQRAVHELLEDA